jgi:hypothetical protein
MLLGHAAPRGPSGPSSCPTSTLSLLCDGLGSGWTGWTTRPPTGHEVGPLLDRAWTARLDHPMVRGRSLVIPGVRGCAVLDHAPPAAAPLGPPMVMPPTR